MDNLAWLFLLLPLTAAVVNGLFFRRAGALAALISLASVLATLGITVSFLLGNQSDPQPFSWIKVGEFQVSLGLILDPLSLGMMLVVTLVGTLVHIFSLGYMADDGAKGRYFAGLSLFMFSMTGIVLADGFLMMFVFWELVGVSSYVLIGHYFAKPSAGDACAKAFLVNRIGDFGFMIGILMVWGMAGTVMFQELEGAQEALQAAPAVLTVATLLIFCGAVGKSAQMPLHVWLPDAMEGPTPVSALIHAATMVAAGVYMLVRSSILIELSEAGQVIAWVGGITAAFAALVAIQQNDIKRILAYSTLSQLGYMVMAVGLHGNDEGMFHLYTHAFFKALLFLGAGAVIFSCHHEQDIWKMGGLAKRMTLTFAAFGIGYAALIAIPGTSGFASKESILAVAYEESLPLFWIAAAVAFLTPFYMTRLMVVVFLGKPRSHAAESAKDSGIVLLIPLIVLAVLSLVSHWSPVAHAFQASVPHHGGDDHGHGHGNTVLIVSLLALIGGVVLGFLLYINRTEDPLRVKVLERRFFIDEVYGGMVKVGQDFVGYLLYALDQLLLSGLVVTGGSKAIEGLGRLLRRLQSGGLQSYGMIFAVGVIALLLFLLRGV